MNAFNVQKCISQINRNYIYWCFGAIVDVFASHTHKHSNQNKTTIKNQYRQLRWNFMIFKYEHKIISKTSIDHNSVSLSLFLVCLDVLCLCVFVCFVVVFYKKLLLLSRYVHFFWAHRLVCLNPGVYFPSTYNLCFAPFGFWWDERDNSYLKLYTFLKTFGKLVFLNIQKSHPSSSVLLFQANRFQILLFIWLWP